MVGEGLVDEPLPSSGDVCLDLRGDFLSRPS